MLSRMMLVCFLTTGLSCSRQSIELDSRSMGDSAVDADASAEVDASDDGGRVSDGGAGDARSMDGDAEPDAGHLVCAATAIEDMQGRVCSEDFRWNCESSEQRCCGSRCAPNFLCQCDAVDRVYRCSVPNLGC